MRIVFPSLLLLLITTFISCNEINYSKAIKKDAERSFRENKLFIYSLEFNGVVINKKVCEYCKINKYVIDIRLLNVDQNVNFKYRQFLPYFSINNEILSLSVTSNLFQAIDKGENIKKTPLTRYIEGKNGEYEILNQKEDAWFPANTESSNSSQK